MRPVDDKKLRAGQVPDLSWSLPEHRIAGGHEDYLQNDGDAFIHEGNDRRE